MFYDFSTDVKEEPEWEDYCISEAQARAGRGVQLGPALEPPTNPKASTASIHSGLTSKNDTETDRNSLESHCIKEESETKPFQEWAGLYRDGKEENLSLRVDLCSGASVNVEIKSKREESKAPVSQKPNVANSRRDLMAINDVAREVNRKRVLQPDTEPVNIKKYTNNVINRSKVINTANCRQQAGYLGKSPPKKAINATKTATANENNLQEVSNLCEIVIINPEADQSRQSLISQLKTHQILNANKLNKNQSLSINSIAHTGTGRSRGSSKTMRPKPTKQIPEIPIEIFRPKRAPIQQNPPERSFQHIKVPISRLGNNVYLKPLNPAKTVTIPNSQSETVTSQPSKPPFKVFSQPVTVLEWQRSIQKLKYTVSNIHNSQPIPKLLNGTLQSENIPILPKAKHFTKPISKSAEVTSQPNILNGKLAPIMSSDTIELSVKRNIERVPDGKILAVAGGAPSNTSVTSVKVNSSAVPIKFSKIAPKPISKLTMNFPTPKPNDNHLNHNIEHNNGQFEVQRKPNIQVTVPNIELTSHNIQRIFAKPISKLIANPELQKPNGNNLIHKIAQNNGQLEVQNKPNIQVTAPNIQLKNPNIQLTSHNAQKIFPKPIFKLTANPQLQKTNANNLLQKVDNNNILPEKSESNLQLIMSNAQRLVPKPISKLITNSQIPKPNDENIYVKIENNNQQPKEDNNASNIQLVPKAELIDDCTITIDITEDHQPEVAKDISSIRQITPKRGNSIVKSVDNNQSRNNDSQRGPNQTNPSYIQPLLLEYLHTTNAPPLIPEPLENPIHSIAKSNINTIHFMQSNKSYGRPELKPNLPLNHKTQPPKVSKLEDQVLSKQHDDKLQPDQISQANDKTEASKKVPKLEDFLTQSYVKLDNLRKRTCRLCKEIYYDKKIFLDHMETHFRSERPDCIKSDSMRTDIKRITCYCQKSFNAFIDLYNHIRRVHITKRYYCDYCSKGLRDKRSLMNHIRTHTGERPYRCSICKRHYRTETNLVSHKAVHSRRDQKHHCPTCDKPFHTTAALNNHLKIHSGLRPHKCGICKQTFIVKHHLQRHIDSHLDERRFSCDYCKMRFLRKSHLLRHITNIHARKLKKEARRLKRERRKRRNALSTMATHEVMESQAVACNVANDT